MRRARCAALAAALGAACMAGGAGCLVTRHVNLGVADDAVRAELSASTIVFAKSEGLFLARGDGTRAERLLASGDLGRHGAIFMPALDASGRRVLFLSVVDLDVRESTGRDLSLNILDLVRAAAPRATIAAWRRIRLESIAPPGAGGRQEIFAVAAAAWSNDGRIALALNRPASSRGDAVAVFGPDGGLLGEYGLPGRDIARVSALSWMSDGAAMILGLDGEMDSPGQVVRLGLPASGARGEAAVVDLGPGRYPALAPDGSRIAVVDDTGGQGDIVLMGSDGRDMGRFQHPAGRALSRPFWAPSGRYLYYYSLASTGPLGLVEITIMRCLDTRTGHVFDLVRLG